MKIGTHKIYWFILVTISLHLSVADTDCREGWVKVNLSDSTEGNPGSLCMKHYTNPLPYDEARQECRDQNSFLIDHDNLIVSQILLNSSLSSVKSALYGSLEQTGDEYWTGLHYDGVTFSNDGMLPSTPKLNIYLCGFYQGQYKTRISAAGAAGWFCGVEDRWSGLSPPPCVSAKIKSQDAYLLQYRTNRRRTTVADLSLDLCTERKQFICMARTQSHNNATSNSAVTKEDVRVSVASSSTSLSCTLSINSVAQNMSRRPRAFVTPQGSITQSVALSSQLQPEDGGSYRCVVWCDEIQDYMYSEPYLVDNGGKFYYSTISLPLLGHTMIEKYYMISYYNTQLDASGDLDLVKTVAAAVLTRSLSLCTNCGTVQLELQHIQSVSDISDWDGVLVAASVVFYLPEETTLNNRDNYTEAWKTFSRDLRQSLSEALQLDVPISEQYLRVDSWRENTMTGVDHISPAPGESISPSTVTATPLAGEPTTVKIISDGESQDVTDSIISGWDFPNPVSPEEPNSTKTPEPEESGVMKQFRERFQNVNTTDADSVIPFLSETSALITRRDNSVTANTEQLRANEVEVIADTLSNISSSISLHNKTVAQQFVGTFVATISKVMDLDTSVISGDKQSPHHSTASQSILNAVDNLIHIELPDDVINSTEGVPLFSIVQPNLAFKLTTERDIVGVTSYTKLLTADDGISYVNTSSPTDRGENSTSPLVELTLNDAALNGTYRKAFLVFANDKLHKAVSSSITSAGRIVSATLAHIDGTPMNISGMDEVVSINYPNALEVVGDKNMASDSLICGYWSPDLQEWSTKGCTKEIKEMGVMCSCNHLTDFSLLLDPHREQTDNIDQFRRIISQIGLAISSIALGLVLLTAAYYKRLREKISQKVLICLAVSLLALNLTFLIGVEQTGAPIVCTAIAVALHYFLLCSFSWMFVEAVLMYHSFVKEFSRPQDIPNFMAKSIVTGFGVPAVIVAVNLTVDNLVTNVKIYPDDSAANYCWLSQESIVYSVLLPIGLVLTANTIIFGLVIHSIRSSNNRMRAYKATTVTERKTAILHLRAAIAISVVFGLTWIFAYLALISKTTGPLFHYLFCIFNSLQGLLIFIFHNLREPTVKSMWVSFCSSGVKKLKSSSSGSSASRGQSGASSRQVFGRQEQSSQSSASPTMKSRLLTETTSINTLTLTRKGPTVAKYRIDSEKKTAHSPDPVEGTLV